MAVCSAVIAHSVVAVSVADADVNQAYYDCNLRHLRSTNNDCQSHRIDSCVVRRE